MTFLYAAELKERFSVVGHFYNLKVKGEVLPCRSVLEIVGTDAVMRKGRRPDAVVVMMNPGSSRPWDREYEVPTYSFGQITKPGWVKEFVPTRPDNAQYQIMRVMAKQGWDYLRVLNLSDLRNPNSGDFAKDFAAAAELDASSPHCMTHAKRADELKDAMKTAKGGPVIAAWGSVEVLRESAETLLKKKKGILGWRPDKDEPWYRYASPYRKDQKLDWLERVNGEIENR